MAKYVIFQNKIADLFQSFSWALAAIFATGIQLSFIVLSRCRCRDDEKLTFIQLEGLLLSSKETLKTFLAWKVFKVDI